MQSLDLPHLDIGPRSGPTVILLHGFPLDHAMWATQNKALADAGVRVMTPDLRGMGRAPHAAEAHGSMAAFASDVLRMAERAGIHRFALVGFSMGGYVALEVARQAPERVSGLALVDTRADADSEETRKGRTATIEKVRAAGVQVLVDAMLPKMLTPTAPPALVEEVRTMMLRTPVEGAVQALQAMATRPDSFATLRAFKGSVLVIVGEHDVITPPDVARAMVEATEGQLVLVPGAHLTPLESAEAVSAALVGWARRLG